LAYTANCALWAYKQAQLDTATSADDAEEGSMNHAAFLLSAVLPAPRCNLNLDLLWWMAHGGVIRGLTLNIARPGKV
jgi:hypothetical protein